MYEDVKEIEKNFKLSDFPLNIAVEVSNYCNLNCIMCAHDKLTRMKGTMNILLYKKVIDEIVRVNPYTRLWLDFYGEPLLQKFKLFYMIDYARKKGLKNISLNSNATLLDEESAEMLLDSGIGFLSFDCDGFSKEVYEGIRIGAKRDTVYSNIEYILNRKIERGLKRPIIEIKIMEMKQNQHEIQQVLRYWKNRGAWTCVRRLISWGGNVDVDMHMSDIDRVACGNAVGILPITWDGKVPLCVMDVDAKFPVGDVNKESIKDIWQSRNETLVKKHLKHQWDDLPVICKKCMDWTVIGEERFDEYGRPVQKKYEHGQVMLGNE